MRFKGVLRITNPKTLENWKSNGKYQNLIDSGKIYAPGCGRFRDEICVCCKCRTYYYIKMMKKETIDLPEDIMLEILSLLPN